MLLTLQSLQVAYFLLSQAGESFLHNIHPEYAHMLQFKYITLFLSTNHEHGEEITPFLYMSFTVSEVCYYSCR